MGWGARGSRLECGRRAGRVRRGICVVASIFGAACAQPNGQELLIPGLARVRVGSIDAAALENAVTGAPPGLLDRSEYLVDLLWEAGCPASEMLRPSGTRVPDVVCALPGRTSHRIVVLAHLDGKVDASGVPRYWRGSALLPFLYRALGAEEREHSFEFAVFGRGPDRRARDYRAWLDQARGGDVRALVEILSLGPETIGFWSSDTGLGQDFLAAAQAVGRPLDSLRQVTRHRLRPRGIPMIAIVSLGDDELPEVGAPRAAETATYHSTARMVAVYLGYLDETLRLRAEKSPPETSSR
jgi:hypothetical protein